MTPAPSGLHRYQESIGMAISLHDVIQMDYRLSTDDGELIASSEESGPLTALVGAGNLLPAIEQALIGKAVGETFALDLAPEAGYGQHDPAQIGSISRKQYRRQAGEQIAVGGYVDMAPNGAPGMSRVVAFDEQSVTLDGNHPLAGKHLHFRITVVAARPATADERSHGHAHGPGGHHH
jgi:FKBP-type peptidyl-prolyl cis-trans isomerase SlyD